MLLAMEADDEMLPVSEWARAAAAFGLDDAGGALDPPRPASEDILPNTSW